MGPAGARYRTTYFRKENLRGEPGAYATYVFSVERDDGFVLYVNGTEVGRNNIANWTVGHTTVARRNVEDSVVNIK